MPPRAKRSVLDKIYFAPQNIQDVVSGLFGLELEAAAQAGDHLKDNIPKCGVRLLSERG